MASHRSYPTEAGSNKLLWAGLAIVVIIVLAMGVSLIWIQSRPPEPRLVVWPALAVPPATTTPALGSASTAVASSATALPPASAANGLLIDTPKPRTVHPRTSEPAVARAPERSTTRPDGGESATPPDVKR